MQDATAGPKKRYEEPISMLAESSQNVPKLTLACVLTETSKDVFEISWNFFGK
jgi:hypothetical protein